MTIEYREELMAQIEVPFGKETAREYLNTKDTTLSAFILEKLIAKLRQEGYKSTGIGRAIFEDALDYDVKFKAASIAKLWKEQHKIPKVIRFDISVPKV